MAGTALLNTVVVANGATKSTPLELNGAEVVGIILPSAMTSTTMTFEMAMQQTSDRALVNADWHEVNSTASSAFSVTFAANEWIVVDPNALSGCQFLRLVMGSAEGADRTIGLVTRSRA